MQQRANKAGFSLPFLPFVVFLRLSQHPSFVRPRQTLTDNVTYYTDNRFKLDID